VVSGGFADPAFHMGKKDTGSPIENVCISAAEQLPTGTTMPIEVQSSSTDMVKGSIMRSRNVP
jgi:hypothetical protein